MSLLCNWQTLKVLLFSSIQPIDAILSNLSENHHYLRKTSFLENKWYSNLIAFKSDVRPSHLRAQNHRFLDYSKQIVNCILFGVYFGLSPLMITTTIIIKLVIFPLLFCQYLSKSIDWMQYHFNELKKCISLIYVLL